VRRFAKRTDGARLDGALLGPDFALDLFAPNNQTTIVKAADVACAAQQPCFVNSGSSTLTLAARYQPHARTDAVKKERRP